MPAAYFAHSSPRPDRSDWQPLAEHLNAVGEGAAASAHAFGAAELARTAGLLHDLGKYTNEFQRRIAGDGARVDHSTHGAIVAAQHFGPWGHLLAYGIAGHHAGLANGVGLGERTPLAERLKGQGLPALDACWENEVALPPRLGVPQGFRVHSKERSNFQLAFLARMLFSCLVDADYLDTEDFYRRIEPGTPAPSPRATATPALPALRERLDTHLSELAARATDSAVNHERAAILRHVRAQATQDAGLFSLTVPTGGGKTLASLAFALDHAIAHNLQRVIFVIPFTSIVEQNAAVFRRALGDLGQAAVLEHHSAYTATPPPASDPERYQAVHKLQLAMENWDAPIIVTTAVQFFESLFAARPSPCRKLHRIAGSVVVLDEAQTLPLKLLRPCVAAIDELARNYRSSIVLCTATQPALHAPAFAGGLEHVRELAPEPTRLFQQLQRVRVRHAGTWNDETLTQAMREREQVLCIVNNRRHARAVFEAMADLPGARHLSTLMCARHRSQALDEVRWRLKRREPCRLVSTSLIEAGVDVDFPTVLRAEAGLDAIAQAAGRCNREGTRGVEASDVLVFATDNPDWAAPPELRQYAQTAREVLRQWKGDPLAPEAIERYFQQCYWQQGAEALDRPNLMGLLRESRVESLPLETLAAEFRLIDDTQAPLIIPYDDDAREALRVLEFAPSCAGLARRLQPYLVQVPRRVLQTLREAGAVTLVAPEKWGEQFMVLANEDLYDPRWGLGWDNPERINPARLNW